MVDCGFADQPGASGRALLVRFGPTVNIEIGFDPAYRPGIVRRSEVPTTRFPALVDTGALQSCIDSELADALKLPVVDQQYVAGVHGKGELSMRLAQIHVPDVNFTIYGEFAGVHLRAGGQPHFALIGRTFLQHFTMTYDGYSGSVDLSRKH